jgi:hypothetical protein
MEFQLSPPSIDFQTLPAESEEEGLEPVDDPEEHPDNRITERIEIETMIPFFMFLL